MRYLPHKEDRYREAKSNTPLIPANQRPDATAPGRQVAIIARPIRQPEQKIDFLFQKRLEDKGFFQCFDIILKNTCTEV